MILKVNRSIGRGQYLDGIQILKNEEGAVCISVNFVSDDLKQIIRTELTEVCHGAAKASRNTRLYSYKRTLSQFFIRYDSKSAETKKGMIGELLTHILAVHFLNSFERISLFFNLEEQSIKKGFDLVLRDTRQGQLWFVEVKSGECNALSSEQKLADLLSIAKNDLKGNLNSDRGTLWENAINGALIAMKTGKLKTHVQKVLEDYTLSAEDGDMPPINSSRFE